MRLFERLANKQLNMVSPQKQDDSSTIESICTYLQMVLNANRFKNLSSSLANAPICPHIPDFTGNISDSFYKELTAYIQYYETRLENVIVSKIEPTSNEGIHFGFKIQAKLRNVNKSATNTIFLSRINSQGKFSVSSS